MTLSPSTPPAWPTSPSVQRQPRTKRDGSAGRSQTATSVGACRASTQASSPSKHYCPTQMEKNSARCRDPADRQDAPLSSCCPGKIIQFFITVCVGLAGSHFAADCRVHLHLGAGEDSAPSTEQPAETLHPGLRGLLLLMCHSFHKPLETLYKYAVIKLPTGPSV